jgi:predicted site-specific integrase-resolvase
MTTIRRVAVYARVSTHEQTCENQLLELRRYVEARGWTATEYVDTGVSGAKDRRPALDQGIPRFDCTPASQKDAFTKRSYLCMGASNLTPQIAPSDLAKELAELNPPLKSNVR